MTSQTLAQPAAAVPDAAGPSMLDIGLVSFGVAAVVLVVWRLVRKRRRPAAAALPDAAPKDRLIAMAERARQADDLERLMREAERYTLATAKELDARAVRLEKLIAEANTTLAALRSAAESASTAAREPTPVRSGSSRIIETLAQPVRTAVTPMESDPPIVEIRPTDSVTQRVLDLADAGRTPLEIARELEEHPGKIELMLALRSTRRGRPSPAVSAPTPRT